MRTQFTPGLQARAIRDFGNRLAKGGLVFSDLQLSQACRLFPAAGSREGLLTAVDAAAASLSAAGKAPPRQLVMEAAAAFFGLRHWDALAAAMPKAPAAPTQPSQPRAYLVAEDWTHIFDDRIGEELVRFCYDCTGQRLLAVEYRHSVNRDWEPASGEQREDVLASLSNYCLDATKYGQGGDEDPDEYGMELVHDLPKWVGDKPGGDKGWTVHFQGATKYDYTGMDENAAYDLAIAAVRADRGDPLWLCLQVSPMVANQPLRIRPQFGAEVEDRASDNDPSRFIRFRGTVSLDVTAPSEQVAEMMARTWLKQMTNSPRPEVGRAWPDDGNPFALQENPDATFGAEYFDYRMPVLRSYPSGSYPVGGGTALMAALTQALGLEMPVPTAAAPHGQMPDQEGTDRQPEAEGPVAYNVWVADPDSASEWDGGGVIVATEDTKEEADKVAAEHRKGGQAAWVEPIEDTEPSPSEGIETQPKM